MNLNCNFDRFFEGDYDAGIEDGSKYNNDSLFEVFNSEIVYQIYNEDHINTNFYQLFWELTNDEFEYFSESLNMNKKSATTIKQPPGSINPLHVDIFYSLRDKLSSEELNRLVRVNIFMEDWSLGECVQTRERTHSHWKKGDYLMWDRTCPHTAINAGVKDKFTMQITGVLNE